MNIEEQQQLFQLLLVQSVATSKWSYDGGNTYYYYSTLPKDILYFFPDISLESDKHMEVGIFKEQLKVPYSEEALIQIRNYYSYELLKKAQQFNQYAQMYLQYRMKRQETKCCLEQERCTVGMIFYQKQEQKLLEEMRNLNIVNSSSLQMMKR